MSYLVYNGKLVKSSNNFVIGIPPEVFTLADFNNTAVTLSESAQPSIRGDMKLNFKMYLDSDSGFDNQVLALKGSNIDFFLMSIKDSSIYVSTNGSVGFSGASYPISPSMSQTILDCEIRKNPYSGGLQKNYPYYFIVNDVSLHQTVHIASGSFSVLSNFSIGRGIQQISNPAVTFNNEMGGGTIWDIKITEVSTGNILNFWKGYGNTLEDWTDFAGSLDAVSIDVMGTRTVPGFVPS